MELRMTSGGWSKITSDLGAQAATSVSLQSYLQWNDPMQAHVPTCFQSGFQLDVPGGSSRHLRSTTVLSNRHRMKRNSTHLTTRGGRYLQQLVVAKCSSCSSNGDQFSNSRIISELSL